MLGLSSMALWVRIPLAAPRGADAAAQPVDGALALPRIGGRAALCGQTGAPVGPASRLLAGRLTMTCSRQQGCVPPWTGRLHAALGWVLCAWGRPATPQRRAGHAHVRHGACAVVAVTAGRLGQAGGGRKAPTAECAQARTTRRTRGSGGTACAACAATTPSWACCLTCRWPCRRSSTSRGGGCGSALQRPGLAMYIASDPRGRVGCELGMAVALFVLDHLGGHCCRRLPGFT